MTLKQRGVAVDKKRRFTFWLHASPAVRLSLSSPLQLAYGSLIFFMYLNEVVETIHAASGITVIHTVGEKVKKWVQAVLYSITSAAAMITHSGFDCLPVVGGYFLGFLYNLLRDALVSGLEKCHFQVKVKRFSHVRLDKVCLIRSLSGFQVTTVVLMYLDSLKIPQRKCKYLF